MENKSIVKSPKNEKIKLKSKKVSVKPNITNKKTLNREIETIKGFNQVIEPKNLDLIPITKWNETLSNLENLNLTNHVSFAFIECKRLFESVLRVFATRWDLGDIEKKKYKNFLRNLKLLSPTLGNIISRLFTLKSRLNKQNLLISEVEEFISLLKRIILTMKVKNGKVHFNFSYNDGSNTLESKIKQSIECASLKQNKGFLYTENHNQQFNNENLWKSLREALFRFEQKSQI